MACSLAAPSWAHSRAYHLQVKITTRSRTHGRERQRCSALSPGCLQQLFQFFDRFSVLRTDWVVTAARICSLQSTNHRPRNRERCATVIRLAHEVPLRGSWNVTAKTVSAKSIDHIIGSSFANLCSIFRHVELEELPIMRCSVEAFVPLDHGLGWNQLNH